MSSIIRRIVLLVSCCFFIASCGNSQTNEQSTNSPENKAQLLKTFTAGRVCDSLNINGVGSPAYAIYLPDNYTPGKKFPCMYFFDAHARVALPLRRYHEIANRLGMILVGCYSSRNGIPWQGNHDAILQVMDFIQHSYNVDSSRIYVGGFSGGSRVAASLAAELNFVSGVVGCAAGYSAGGSMLTRKFSWFGIAGDYDFNLSEMKQLDGQMEQKGYQHQLLALSGYHDWPSAEDYSMAMLWLRFVEMKNKIVKVDTAFVNELHEQYSKRIAQNKKANDDVKVYQLLKGEISLFAGLLNTAPEQAELTKIEQSPAIAAIVTDSKYASQELQLQNEYKQRAMTFDEKGLKSMVDELKSKAKKAPTPGEKQMYQRVLNYMNLIFYLASDGSIKQGREADAAKFLNVFTYTDPKNPDVNYLKAVQAAGKNDFQTVIKELKNAEQLGYNQPETIMFNQVFAPFLSNPEMVALLKTLKAKQQ